MIKMIKNIVYILILTFNLYDFIRSSSITYVSIHNSDDTCNELNRNCSNIESALNIAKDYDEVHIFPGVYFGLNNTNLCSYYECAHHISLVGLGSLPSDVLILYKYSISEVSPVIAISIISDTITYISNLEFKNFTSFKKFHFDKGAGSIEIKNSNVTFDNVIFSQNFGQVGGAIQSLSSEVTIKNCLFENNKAQLKGAAIAATKTVVIIFNSNFSNNALTGSSGRSIPAQSTGTGGAIFVTESQLVYIESSYFLNNTADGTGGGIYMGDHYGNLTIKHTIFQNNIVTGNGNCVSTDSCNSRGGALFVSALNITLFNCSFDNNYAESHSATKAAQGGAIYSTSPTYDGSILSHSVSIIDCHFKMNHATEGGAWYIYGQDVNVLRSMFESNYVIAVDNYFADFPSQGGAIYFSSGDVAMSESLISNCKFINNSAFSGWGGAFFGIDSTKGNFIMYNSEFIGNKAYSSYINQGHGGALMVTSSFKLFMSFCTLIENTVLPYLDLTPLTYSGQGGAIYAQTVELNVSHCNFHSNYALTGQLDSGASGGAIVVQNCEFTYFAHNNFTANGCAGYYGYSIFASPGTAGAIYVKFSQAQIYDCTFDDNWVSAGTSEASLGGAIAVFFDYQNKDGKTNGVQIGNNKFRNNFAYGHICNNQYESGDGGAISTAGASNVLLYGNEFLENIAVSYSRLSTFSLGGAISISLKSNLTTVGNNFTYNYAYNGAGNDIASVSGQKDEENYVNSTKDTFSSFQIKNKDQDITIKNKIVSSSQSICSLLSSRMRIWKTQSHSKTYVHSSITKFNSYEQLQQEVYVGNKKFYSIFPVSVSWNTYLTNQVSNITTTTTSDGSDRHHHNIAISSIRNKYSIKSFNSNFIMKNLKHINNSNLVINSLLRLDVWTSEYESGNNKFDQLENLEKRYRYKLLNELSPFNTNVEDSFQVISKHSMPVFRAKSAQSSRTEEFYLRLKDFAPDIVVTSGTAFFTSAIFTGDYHVFIGNLPTVLQSLSNNPDIDKFLVTVPSYAVISDPIVSGFFTLTAIDATLEFVSNEIIGSLRVDQLNLFNASLFINSNLSVKDVSFITDSTIVGNKIKILGNIQAKHPYVIIKNYLMSGIDFRNVYNGYIFEQLETDIPERNISIIRTFTTFDSCTLMVEGNLILSSSFDNLRNTSKTDETNLPAPDYTNAQVNLLNNAEIYVKELGNLTVLVDVYVNVILSNSSTSSTLGKRSRSQSVYNYSGIINAGYLSLLGHTQLNYLKSLDYQLYNYLDTPSYSRSASLGSLNSRLVVSGTFIQTVTGNTFIFLNSSYQKEPVLFLHNSLDYQGSMQVSYYSDGDNSYYPNLVLYDTDTPSSWSIVAFQNKFSSLDNLHLDAPLGLKYKPIINQINVQYGTDSEVHSFYAWSIEITNIGCSQISEYYADIADSTQSTSGYKCYICLKNSTCNLCDNNMCADHGTGNCANVLHSSSCCSGDCNYGSCEANNADHDSFYCNCDNQIWYDGSHCDNLSTLGLSIILASVSTLLLLLVVGFFYRRSLQQKQQVLEELADGILNPQMDGSNREYIQYMQQALILNDVFVKFEEIKLESIVGEGSFGVVYKASFRGAQVAVKKMRSMFTELTEKEIDEFRKEAYVMSRLRHPNIVLVMGISLVDQDPISAPKSRMQNQDPDLFESDPPENKKTKPQSTVCIITEFLDQGSLADILYGSTKLPAEIWTYELVLTCAIQAARGMLYLHSHKPSIIHRDLKSSNLVVDNHWVVKVTDFGMSRIVPENVQQIESGILPANTSSRSRKKSNELSIRSHFNFSFFNDKSDESPEIRTNSFIRATSVGLDPDGDLTAIVASTDTSPGKSALNISSTLGTPQPVHANSGVYNSNSRISNLIRSVNTNNENSFRPSTTNPEMTSNLGTTAWCAPEVFTANAKTRYTVKVDVYSFALVLWELWEKKRPFEELHSRFDIMDAVRLGKRPTISSNCPPSYRSLIQRCWQNDPSRRPMFNYIVRYLKDELARVKRQKQLNVNTSSDASGDGVRTSGGLGDALSFLRKSFIATNNSSNSNSNQQLNAFQSSGLDNVEETSRRTTSNHSSSRGSVMEFDNSYPNNNRKTFDSYPENRKTLIDNYPDNRKTLVDVVQSERSLSYLTESPALFGNSGLMASSWQQQQQNKTPKKDASNKWRDNYVLKFSGWKNSNPDQGLPPSMQAHINTPQPLQQQQQQQRTQQQTIVPIVNDVENGCIPSTLNPLRTSDSNKEAEESAHK